MQDFTAYLYFVFQSNNEYKTELHGVYITSTEKEGPVPSLRFTDISDSVVNISSLMLVIRGDDAANTSMPLTMTKLVCLPLNFQVALIIRKQKQAL